MEQPVGMPTAGIGIELPGPELQMLRLNARSGFNYRYRRHFDWDDNYELYRDQVKINRLTQRQSVNLPLMKLTVKTLLKDVDDMPVLYFENQDNDENAEMFLNDYWKWTVDHNRMELQDIVDKRQVFLFGRSFDQWQIVDGAVKQTIIDPMDMLVERFVDPFNLHSARWLIHEHNMIPLTVLSKNKDYDQEAVNSLQNFYAGQQGIIKAKENQITLTQKNLKMAEIGVPDIQSPVLGETYVELSLHYVYRNDEPILDKEGNPTGELYPEQIWLYVLADYMMILMKKPLEEVMGVTKDHYWRNHFPYVTWADDVERQDFWSDATGDIVRTPNKILNAWFSQLVESRTLRNFGMNYYNSNLEGFNPQTFVPTPFGWYGIPVPPNSDIRSVFQPVPIPELKDSLEEMNFVINILEKATGATSTQQGVPEQKQVTLGEIQLMVGEAQSRVKGMSKFYTPAWQERGMMFLKLIEAAPDKLDAVKIFRKGKNTNHLWARTIDPSDWMTPAGSIVKVWSQEERNSQNVDEINKVHAASSLFPGNAKMKEIERRKALSFAGVKPNDVNEVMKEQEKIDQAGMPGAQAHETLTIPYQLAPPDIQRQMEIALGFKPSTQGVSPAPNQPQTPTPGGPTQPPAPVTPPGPLPTMTPSLSVKPTQPAVAA